MSPARLWHALVALLALIGIAIEYWVKIAGHPGELFDRTITVLSFFTILTNAIVLAASLGIAIGHGPLHRWAIQPRAATAITLYITVVAVIFQLLLAALVHLSPLGWWGNMLLHKLVPAMWMLGWLVLAPHGGIDRMAPLRWLIYPLVYTVWIVIHGAATGWYPYPFMDIGKYGVGPTATKMAAIALFFAGLGYALRWIDGRLAMRRMAPA